MKSTKNESLFFGDIEVFIDLYSLYPIIFMESGYFKIWVAVEVKGQNIWKNSNKCKFLR